MSVFFRRRGEAPPKKLASDYAIGESVFLIENGSPVEYLVVHQGLPSSMYDSSCNGTWLLRKDIYTKRDQADEVNDYERTSIHSLLNGSFLRLFDSNIQNAIKQIKLPYHKGTGSDGSIKSGTSGLSTKVFLLGGYEVGWTTSKDEYLPKDGAALSYFTGTSSVLTSKRIGYYNGTATGWWFRSPYTGSDDGFFGSSNGGNLASVGSLVSYGVRPALILDSNTKFNIETNIMS